jgi:hypothetical protein
MKRAQDGAKRSESSDVSGENGLDMGHKSFELLTTRTDEHTASRIDIVTTVA